MQCMYNRTYTGVTFTYIFGSTEKDWQTEKCFFWSLCLFSHKNYFSSSPECLSVHATAIDRRSFSRSDKLQSCRTYCRNISRSAEFLRIHSHVEKCIQIEADLLEVSVSVPHVFLPAQKRAWGLLISFPCLIRRLTDIQSEHLVVLHASLERKDRGGEKLAPISDLLLLSPPLFITCWLQLFSFSLPR